MKKYLFILGLISTLQCFGQEYSFGKVSKKELSRTVYEKDSAAVASYIYRYRRTFIEYYQGEGFRTVTEVHNRIKIYQKEGVDLATENIVYYTPEGQDKEQITSIKAYTFNLTDGKVTKDKVDKNSIFNEKKNDFYSIRKVPFPNVNPGSVLDIKYRLISPYTNYIDNLEYQFEIPVEKLEYTVAIPSFFKFNKINKGYYFIAPEIDRKNTTQKITYTTQTTGYSGPSGRSKGSYDMNYYIETFRYKADHVPALRDDEPFVNNVSSYRGGLKYELVSVQFPDRAPQFYSKTWESISKQIYKSEDFGEQIKRTGYYKEDLATVISGAVKDEEKIGRIFAFVKSKLKWNGNYGKYTQNGVRKTYKEGVGNVADVNLILVSMLRSAGLSSYPVLVSSRNNGVPLSPTLNGFNYVIAAVNIPNKGMVLMDATEPYAKVNELPNRAINWNGRIIKEEGYSDWVTLEPITYAMEERNLSLKFTADNSIEGFSRSRYFNYAALNHRKNYNHLSDDDIMDKIESRYNIEIDNFKVVDKLKIGNPVAQVMKFQSEAGFEIINNKFYITPLFFLAMNSSPFKSEERKYPVDFNVPFKEVYNVSWQIPEGYSIESVPTDDSFVMLDELGSFSYKVLVSGKRLKVSVVTSINKSKIGPDYYSVLKQFFDEIVKKHKEKIVLVKS